MGIDDDILAFAYLNKEGDERNKVLLTKEKLFVIHHKRAHEFYLDNTKDLSFNHRKIMMPLIIGGIMTSLSLVAMFKEFFDPFVVISTLMAGLVLFYIGWNGQTVFTVNTKIKDYDFSVPVVTDNLKTFVEFLSDARIFSKKAHDEKFTFFLIFDRSYWNLQTGDKEFIELPEKPFKAFLYKQIKKKPLKNVIIVEFNALEAGSEVRFIKNHEDGKLQPFIMDNIKKQSIVNIEEV